MATPALLAKLKEKRREMSFDVFFFVSGGAIILALVLLGGGVFAFTKLVTSVNNAVSKGEEPPEKVVGGVDFSAIDVIALKLGIELPARDIPSAKFIITNKPPLIFNFTTVRPQVLPGDTSPIFLTAIDPDGDILETTWTSSGGIISALGPLGPANWIAPKQAGEYAVRVAVTDNKPGHQPVNASLTIRVLPSIPQNVPPEDLPAYTTRLVGLVKEEGSDELFLIKSEGPQLFKRLLVNPVVVNYYPDLDLNLVQTVPKGTLDAYTLSTWVRGRERFRVYEVNRDGTKQWFNMPWETFLGRGGSDEAVFTVNDNEIEFYPSGPDILP